jgi:predicted dehydrogenase
MRRRALTRRSFLARTAGAVAGGLAFPAVVPSHVIGAPGQTPPSEVITRGVIGVGGRGSGFVLPNEPGKAYRTLAVCDVDAGRRGEAVKKAGSPCEGYRDFRQLLDRRDIDVVYIATPPHWHALICLHAAQAGKDIYCEKPMTRFIAEGRAVADAVKRYGRVFHIGTAGRYGQGRLRKLVASGLLGSPLLVRVDSPRYNWKVKEWSGRIDLKPRDPPADLDWELWLGPAPWKPYHPHRCHGSFRGYWDYDGGGFSDMGAHYLDPLQYVIGADGSGPASIEAEAPWPAHPDAVGMWGRIRYTYADGTVLQCTSGEWWSYESEKDPPLIEGPRGKVWSEGRTDPPDLFEKLKAFPDPPALVTFEDALRTREEPGGNAEASHRVATVLHLGNLAIRLGRKLAWDPVREEFPGDPEANRFVNLPMRAPWHL